MMQMRMLRKGNIAISQIILALVVLVLTEGPMAANKFLNDQERSAYLFPAKAFDDGFYDVAIGGFESYLSLFPHGAMRHKAKFFIALSHYYKKEYIAAREAFDNLFKEDLKRDDQAQALYWYGQTLLALNSFDEAAEAFSKSFKNDPASDSALFYLGWSHRARRDLSTSMAQLKRLEALFPESEFLPQAQYLIGELLFELKDYRQAASRLSYLLKQYPALGQRERVLFLLAESYYNLEKYGPARERYSQYLREFPNGRSSLNARYGLAWSAYMGGSFGVASDQLLKALSGPLPEELASGARYLLAKSNLRLKNNDKSASQYLDFIGFDKGGRWSEAAFSELGSIFYSAGSYAISAELFEKAFVIASGDDSKFFAKFMLGQNYYAMGEYEKALEQYRIAAKLGKFSEHSAEILHKMALSLSNLERFQEAIAAFDELAVLYSGSRQAAESAKLRQALYARAADAEMKRGDYKKALAHYAMLTNKRPGASEQDGVLAFKIGLANFQLGNYDRALAQFQVSMADPSLKSEVRAEALFLLGTSFAGRGACRKAAEALGVFSQEYARWSARGSEASYLNASCLEKLGLWDKGMAGYLASALAPGFAEKARLRTGFALLKKGEPHRAARHLEHASNSSEVAVRAESEYWLAETYARADSAQKALALLEKVWNESGGAAPWPQLAKLKAAAIYEELSRLKEAERLYGELAREAQLSEIRLKAKERLNAIEAQSKPSGK